MIKYGSHVAFLFEGTIRFGVLAAIVNRIDEKGETTTYVVNHNWQEDDGSLSAAIDVSIKDEADLADMHAWNKDDEILRLARRSALWEKAKAQSDAILNPVEPAPAPGAVAVPDPAPSDKPTDPKDIF